MGYRIIYSLYVDMGPPTEGPPQSTTALVVQLNRQGMPLGGRHGNGRPRAPKNRTIDLRPGDEILCEGRWRRIRSITAYREHLLTEAQALACEGNHGYIYRIAEPVENLPDISK